mmetsp:Transcript_14733/g.33551  ORF Transcript_14733/g.33551 Transcript_14733/m.33551 type:complete len:241 (-) Transcript_14733:472-1194(-)
MMREGQPVPKMLTKPTQQTKRAMSTSEIRQRRVPKVTMPLVRTRLRMTSRGKEPMPTTARTARARLRRTMESRVMLLTTEIKMARTSQVTRLTPLRMVTKWERTMVTWSKPPTVRMGLMVTRRMRKRPLALPVTKLEETKLRTASSLPRRQTKFCWRTLSTMRWTRQNCRESCLLASFRKLWRRSKDLLALISERSTTSRCWTAVGSFTLLVTPFAYTTSRPGSNVCCMAAKMVAWASFL